MFRNLRLYRLQSDWPESAEELAGKLLNTAFKPCGSFTERSSGWEAPGGETETILARRIGGADLLRLRSQTRLLPPAAINEALEERVREFRNRTQRDPGRKEKRELKEAVHAELVPKALLKSERTWGFYLASEKLLGIDTASDTQADRFLETLRDALATLRVTPLGFKQSLAGLLTRIFLGQGPTNFVLGRECRMLDPSVGGASVSWLDIELTDASVRRHVREGLRLDRLAIVFDDLLSCVIDQEGVLRKLKLLGLDASTEYDAADTAEPLARLDAEFALPTGTLRRLLTSLQKHLGGYD